MRAEPSDAWWNRYVRSPELQQVALGDLVGDLATLREVPIPYGRLPVRAHSVYGNHFHRWSQLADESIESLMAYPMAGMATVRAVVMAACDAVAAAAAAQAGNADAPHAVSRLLERLPDQDRAVLAARTWALHPVSHRTLAPRLGVSATWFSRREPRINAAFADLLADPAHGDLLAHAAQLRRQIGPYAPASAVDEALRERGMSIDGPPGTVLLYVAGPYTPCEDGWLEVATAAGARTADDVVNAEFEKNPAPTTSELVAALAGSGMPAGAAHAHLARLTDVRRVGDVWVRWGQRLPDKIAAVLSATSTPSTADDINAIIDEGYPEQSVREVMSLDPRFHRHTRQRWALRQWGLSEYRGTAAAIGDRIDAAGGRAAVADVVADVVAAFPDVAETSVRTYLTRPAFVIENATVRRRTDTDPWSTPLPIRFARGAFVHGPNAVRVAFPVTGELLRGSGQRISPAVATYLEMTPGDQRTYATPYGHLSIEWSLTHTGWPSVGSLRRFAQHAGAQLDDELLLVFDPVKSAVHAIRIAAGEDPTRRLRMLLGLTSIRAPISALSRAMNCAPDHVIDALLRRGEHDILALLAD